MGYTDIKEIFKDAKNIATGANDLQLKNHLLEIQNQMYELLDENRNLRLELEELKNKKKLESDLEYCGDVYFDKDNNRYYCTNCWDVEKILSSAVDKTGIDDLKKVFYCQNCKSAKFTDIVNDLS